MHLDHGTNDGQTQAAAAASGLAGAGAAVETLEDMWQLCRVDADARVDHLEPGTMPVLPERHGDGSAAGRELEGVAHEVAHDLAESLGVVANHERRRGELGGEAHATTFRRRLGLLDRGLHSRAQVVGAQIEPHEPGVQLRQFEQVLREPVEPLDLLSARFEEFSPGRDVVAGLLLEQLIESPESGERSPELMRDVCQELAAGVAIAADDVHRLLELGRHRVELARELGDLGRPRSGAVRRHAPGKVAFGKRSSRIGQTAQRSGEAASEHRCHDDRQQHGAQRCQCEEPDDGRDGALARGIGR